MKYHSTRSKITHVDASQAILMGIAPDGGLFVPSEVVNFRTDFDQMKELSYDELTQIVLEFFLNDFDTAEIEEITRTIYEGTFATNDRVCLKKLGEHYVLELYHGPTLAFKDMALSALPKLMSKSMEKQNIKEQIIILVATSGDTGSAALSGFENIKGISTLVFFPKDGVSEVQKQQMLSFDADNVAAYEVIGNFDDAQTAIKEIFADSAFKRDLKSHGYSLSSANSINIGRLIPQIVYYYYAYLKLLKDGEIVNGDAVNIVVPTGNFGNILAGFYAKMMGLPIENFICASNQNDVLTKFFNEGIYDINRIFYKTISPSMDILISSNLERYLYYILNRDVTLVSKKMNQLKTEGRFSLPHTVDSHHQNFYAYSVDESTTLSEINSVYQRYHYVMDPHTAVANHAMKLYQTETGDTKKCIVLSTASPFKFAETVLKAIEAPLSAGRNGVQQLSQRTGLKVPHHLIDLLNKNKKHTEAIALDKIKKVITEGRL